MKRWAIGWAVVLCCIGGATAASAAVTQVSVTAVGDARIEVTTQDGRVTVGYVRASNAASMVVVSEDGEVADVPYDEITRLRMMPERVSAPQPVAGLSSDAPAPPDEASAASDVAPPQGDRGDDAASVPRAGYLGEGSPMASASVLEREAGPYRNRYGTPYAVGFEPQYVSRLVAKSRHQRIWGGVLVGVGAMGVASSIAALIAHSDTRPVSDDLPALLLSAAMVAGGTPLILIGRKNHEAAAAYQRGFLMTPTAARGGAGVQVNARF